jgi:hypothetical protein
MIGSKGLSEGADLSEILNFEFEIPDFMDSETCVAVGRLLEVFIRRPF